MPKYLEPEEHMVFDVYFAGVVAMNLHPGIGRSNGHGTAPAKMDLQECAGLVLDMIRIRRHILNMEAPE
jgi:hypothetical protein